MTKTPAKPPHPVLNPGLYIKRRTNGGVQGWRVRVQERDLKVDRLFSDGPWGGMAQSLAAARHWRDQQPWYRSTANASAKPRRDAQAALLTAPEVVRHESLLMIDGQPRLCAFWSANWTDATGRTWTRKFSVNFWGEDVAQQKALKVHALKLRGAQASGVPRVAKGCKEATNSAEFEAAGARRRA